MEINLPSVDTLIKMAQDDPEGLELLREKLCSQLIDNAPKRYQRRLNGLQFQINMARERSNNNLHSCIKLSEMMLASYQKLQTAINNLKLEDAQANSHNQAQNCAEVIDFKNSSRKA